MVGRLSNGSRASEIRERRPKGRRNALLFGSRPWLSSVDFSVPEVESVFAVRSISVARRLLKVPFVRRRGLLAAPPRRSGMRVAVAGTFGPIHDGHLSVVGSRPSVRRGARDRRADERRTRGRDALRLAADPVLRGAKAITRVGRRNHRRAGSRRDDQRTGRPAEIIVDDPAIDALVASPETVDELEAINETRRDRGLDPLTGIVAPHVLAEDGDRISSTRIVRGEIDERGAPLDTL